MPPAPTSVAPCLNAQRRLGVVPAAKLANDKGTTRAELEACKAEAGAGTPTPSAAAVTDWAVDRSCNLSATYLHGCWKQEYDKLPPDGPLPTESPEKVADKW